MRYTVCNRLIEPDDYVSLRYKCGLSERKIMAAIIGLPNSLCCISILDTYHNNKLVGLLRLVGDGGCYCQIVDLCVLPEYPKEEICFLLMNELANFIKNDLPESCLVDLIQDS